MKRVQNVITTNPIPAMTEELFKSGQFIVREKLVSYKRSIPESQLRSSRAVADLARRYIGNDMDYREAFCIACVNTKLETVSISKISTGGARQTIVDTRIVAQHALLSNAQGVIAVHSHPSGNCVPSQEDKHVTKKLYDTLKLFDIELLDHIIVTSETHLSFRDEGLMEYATESYYT